MFRSICLLAILMSCYIPGIAQTGVDTAKTNQLEEVVIISAPSSSQRAVKPLATLDQYLESSPSINMIRRGSYAWEPFINGMASERSVITIDGMRIYGACTDKMDPITSYLEITNLARANVHGGQAGSIGGEAIAGSMDLERRKSGFGNSGFKGSAFAGFETNNQQKISGTSVSYSGLKFFSDVDLTIRDAENYKAGAGQEIWYSQFAKYNMSAVLGYKPDARSVLEASLIYDRATDVGYPALPMDVSLAKALIGSVVYVREHLSPVVHRWETKLYYNNVTHIMDDTKRPDVPIRMDMPGWSKTVGFYSLLTGISGHHSWKMNLSGHQNRSIAEMTMFSNTPGERDMFMLTWPGVYTNYGDFYAEDALHLSDELTGVFNLGIGVHNNEIHNDFGLESLRIFYPQLEKDNTRLLKRFSATLQHKNENWEIAGGVGYGERAPSVSEGYGFYLFNSFDRFDYIGNPGMNNEKSVSMNGMVAYAKSEFSLKLSSAYYHIMDYIIGRPATELSVMTIGASGVKIYKQLSHADLLSVSLDLGVQMNKNWRWTGIAGYRRGNGAGVSAIPLMQPLTYKTGIAYATGSFSADVMVEGAFRQNRFNPDFGETAASAYRLFNLSAAKQFAWKGGGILLKAGVENLLDRKYSTFGDWNRILRPGRNVFLNVIYNF